MLNYQRVQMILQTKSMSHQSPHITLRDLWITMISRLHPIKVMMKPIINPNYQWVVKFGTKSSNASQVSYISILQY